MSGKEGNKQDSTHHRFLTGLWDFLRNPNGSNQSPSDNDVDIQSLPLSPEPRIIIGKDAAESPTSRIERSISPDQASEESQMVYSTSTTDQAVDTNEVAENENQTNVTGQDNHSEKLHQTIKTIIDEAYPSDAQDQTNSGSMTSTEVSKIVYDGHEITDLDPSESVIYTINRVKLYMGRQELTEAEKRNNRTFYEGSAELYASERADNPGNIEKIAKVLIDRTLPYLKKEDKILILGSGTGMDLLMWQVITQKLGLNCTFFGMDQSYQMSLQAAKRYFQDGKIDVHNQGRLILADATQGIPFKDGEFDFTIGESLDEHQGVSMLRRSCNEIHRVTKFNPDRVAHFLLGIRSFSNKNAIIDAVDSFKSKKNGLHKAYVSYGMKQFTGILAENGMYPVEMWKARGGTPSLQILLPFITTIGRMNEPWKAF